MSYRQASISIVLLFLSTVIASQSRASDSQDAGEGGTASKAGDSAAHLAREMKRALEPSRASIREVQIVLDSADGPEVRWRAHQVREPRADGSNRIALVMTEPQDIRGTAMLIKENPDGPDSQWIWLPALQRVRRIIPVTRFEQFLGTDFTYADLGFVPLHDRSFEQVEVVDDESADSTVLRETVSDEPWFYSRVDTWLDPKTHLPTKRLIYDEAGQLWKRETFGEVELVDGVPTPLEVRMEDVIEGSVTTLRYSNVEYRADLPDAIFEPPELPQLVDNAIFAAERKEEEP